MYAHSEAIISAFLKYNDFKDFVQSLPAKDPLTQMQPNIIYDNTNNFGTIIPYKKGFSPLNI